MIKCKDCRYWHPDQKAGDCRRHAPVIIWGRGEHEDCIETHCPETGPNFWCGEGEPKDKLAVGAGLPAGHAMCTRCGTIFIPDWNKEQPR